MVNNLSNLTREQKLTFIKDGCWKLFTNTGDIKYYARYRGADQLLKENRLQKTNDGGYDLGM